MTQANMPVFIASDHAGTALKSQLVAWLKEKSYEVKDLGTSGVESVDYPDFAQAVAAVVLANPSSLGVVICGTGIGVSISANRFKGIRCALCHDVTMARLGRQHNNANILALGARMTAAPLAEEILSVFLTTDFEGGRHEKRLIKIEQAAS